jgi:predicted ATPase
VESHGREDGARPNLPSQLTSFIGRERELADIQRLLATTRILTLVGAGGIGKTRLAIPAAAHLGTSAERVWFIDLAAFSDPALVTQAVASAFDVREQPDRPVLDTLIDVLRPRRALLLLDNCEHLVNACALLAERLLRACPGLSLLATSREPAGRVR